MNMRNNETEENIWKSMQRITQISFLGFVTKIFTYLFQPLLI